MVRTRRRSAEIGPGHVACLLLLCMLMTCFTDAKEQAAAGVQLSFPELDDEVFVTYSAAYASPAPPVENPQQTRLYHVSKNGDGCGPHTLAPPNGNEHWTAIIFRGGPCTFREKIIKAQEDGANAVIIVNTKRALYNASDDFLMDPCSLNCEKAHASSEDECKLKGGCYSCAENVKIGSGEFCCVEDTLIDMYVGKPSPIIPAFFASIEDGERYLIPRAQTRTSCIYFERPTYEIEPSLIIIGTLGVLVLTLASYRAVSKERAMARWIWSVAATKDQVESIRTTHEDVDQEQVHLTVGQAWGFVLTATCVLIFLFFVVQFFPHTVVRILQVLFAIGATGALAKFTMIPLLKRVLGSLGDRPLRSCPSICFDDRGETTVTRTLGITSAGVIALVWVVFRHASFAWVILDVLAANVVASFLLTIRLPSLKVGAALLISFFFYDIFMVFISPSFFSGRSVMVDVATAGKAREEADAFSCHRQAEEQVPMLLTVPRFDWYGGYSLLGLGDIVLPGMLVVLALRFDYAKLRHSHRDLEEGSTPFPRPSFSQIHAYYIPLVVAYAIGLFTTFVANIRGWTINGVRGQPALLYLVPCTLGTFVTLAWMRSDLGNVWSSTWQEWEDSMSENGPDRTESGEYTQTRDRIPSL